MMRSVHGTLILALVLGGCSTGEEPTGSSTESSVASIESALEVENGGFEMQDELASFGQPELPDLDGLDLEPNLSLPELPGLDALEGKQPLPMPPPLPCPHGGLKGKWKELKKGFGVFFGKWGTLDGKLHGHLKGIYGKNKQGEGVFFGKYINLGGKFVGLIKGRYQGGFFKGRWFDKGGLRGELGGIYGKGEIKGLWHAFCPQCAVKCEPGFQPGQGDPNAPQDPNAGVKPGDPGAGTGIDPNAGPGIDPNAGAGTDPNAGAKPGDPGAGVDPNAKPEGGPEGGLGMMGAPMPEPQKCLCLPPKVVPCMMGKCPDGLVCDLCPPLCKPGDNCPAVCGPPVCVPKPPMPPMPPKSSEAPGAENIPLS